MLRKALAAAALCAGAFAQDYHAVASNKAIMAAIQKPAMDALSGMAKAGGPQDDTQWEQAQHYAAILAESAQLLLLGNRPKDQDLWLRTSKGLDSAATQSMKAAEAKDVAAWKASLGAIGKNCRGCHDVHRPKKQAPPAN